jgi:hypothetical protein
MRLGKAADMKNLEAPPAPPRRCQTSSRAVPLKPIENQQHKPRFLLSADDWTTNLNTSMHSIDLFYPVLGFLGGVPGRDACIPLKAYLDFFSAGFRICAQPTVNNERLSSFPS